MLSAHININNLRVNSAIAIALRMVPGGECVAVPFVSPGDYSRPGAHARIVLPGGIDERDGGGINSESRASVW